MGVRSGCVAVPTVSKAQSLGFRMRMDLIIPRGIIMSISMDTAPGIIRLIQGVIPGAMAGTTTFDKEGSCLSMEKTHHKNEGLLIQVYRACER